MTRRTVALRAAGTALVPGIGGHGLPRVLHWGAELGPHHEALATAASPPVAHAGTDVPLWLSLLPTQAEGWRGQPGIAGHHDGAVSYPSWTVHEVAADPLEDTSPDVGGQVTIEAG